ncbi:hypothetical protein HBN50_10140 [Halobacteriovorax sp. GB3]|uniref:VC0807 family protein n=1 Tax=Halobacteriovorax sp. GB3 TaxID=2719615 RepID=UPI0023600A35|nr:VC0807 family protein [Halobacteriovorax sp. GB3]MDD0853460.1 hypothetical protein [Halobacteriovorax sp. GB3]
MSEVKKEKKENGLVNILINVIIPSVILTKFSGEEHLGQQLGLVVALAFPIAYGGYDFIQKKKVNFFSALGLISVLMTGGIGLLNLNRQWMIAKETGIPLIMGLAVIGSQFTKVPLVRTFMGQILDLEKIDSAFKEKGHEDEFEKNLIKASYYLAGTFFVSAILNYVLAVRVLVGEPGTSEFNESLGTMTALSFPVIAVPTTIMVGIILFKLLNSIKSVAGLEFEEVIKQ